MVFSNFNQVLQLSKFVKIPIEVIADVVLNRQDFDSKFKPIIKSQIPN